MFSNAHFWVPLAHFLLQRQTASANRDDDEYTSLHVHVRQGQVMPPAVFYALVFECVTLTDLQRPQITTFVHSFIITSPFQATISNSLIIFIFLPHFFTINSNLQPQPNPMSVSLPFHTQRAPIKKTVHHNCSLSHNTATLSTSGDMWRLLQTSCYLRDVNHCQRAYLAYKRSPCKISHLKRRFVGACTHAPHTRRLETASTCACLSPT